MLNLLTGGVPEREQGGLPIFDEPPVQTGLPIEEPELEQEGIPMFGEQGQVLGSKPLTNEDLAKTGVNDKNFKQFLNPAKSTEAEYVAAKQLQEFHDRGDLLPIATAQEFYRSAKEDIGEPTTKQRGTGRSAMSLEGEAKKYKSAEEFVEAQQKGVFYHGTPMGQFGKAEIHIGTERAAKQALEARIGIRADGKAWDGTSEYGNTLLAGKKTLRKLDPKGYNETGFNVDVPENDFYLKDHPELAKATFGDGTKIPLYAKPKLFPVKIKGEMTNYASTPMSDTKANATIRAMLKKGQAKRGYYYENIGEDAGSISAVVPSKEHLEIGLTKSQLTDIWNKAQASEGLEGEPYKRKVYRGISKETPVDKGFFGKGTYYSTGIETARGYGGENIVEGEITLKNPFVVDSSTTLGTMEANKLIEEKNLRQKLEKKGHDGIVIKGWHGTNADEVVAFYPKKSVKSLHGKKDKK
jgi:hypothetical protein